MNVFDDESVAKTYDDYYKTDIGKKVDEIEKELIREHLDNIPVKPMLELGCGTGHWTSFFVQQGYQVLATDSSKKMLRIAEQKQLKSTTFHRADILDLPFENKTFAVVAAVAVLEFVEDKQKAFSEMHRVLEPGGWLLLGCLHAASTLGKSNNTDDVYKHGSFFTESELQKFLASFGNPTITRGVHFSPSFDILDGTDRQNEFEPAFLAASVQKT